MWGPTWSGARGWGALADIRRVTGVHGPSRPVVLEKMADGQGMGGGSGMDGSGAEGAPRASVSPLTFLEYGGRVDNVLCPEAQR